MDLKIIYFDLPFWRAEISRLPLFIANIDFEASGLVMMSGIMPKRMGK